MNKPIIENEITTDEAIFQNKNTRTNKDSKNHEKLAKSSTYKVKAEFEEKECKVLGYNAKCKVLSIVFDGFGLEINNVNTFNNSEVVTVKYMGEIGKSNFVCKL